MTITCALAWALVLIMFPLILLWNLTESRSTKIKRSRRNGKTWKQIGQRYGVSASTARRWANA